MRLQWIARWVIVSVVLSGVPVWAQEQPSERTKLYTCGVTLELWNTLSAEQQASVCASVQQHAATSNPDRTKAIIGVIGVLTAAAGVGAVLHFGQENADILGDRYCVDTNYIGVHEGSCGGPLQTKIGLIMIGAGVLTAYVAIKSFSVSPMITKHTKGVSGKIAWGGGHGKQ